jgi:dihydroorotate dehydrogenase electron transfer subunit
MSPSPTRLQTVEGRPGDGPVRVVAEVLARRREGAYHTLSISAPDIAERARPGQFVELAVQAPQTLLRRPFSIAKVSRSGPAAGTVDVVFDAHGPGTDWLARLSTHDTVDVVGPLGSGFPLPQQKVSCLLIGGGYGVAPLFMLAEELTRAGLRVDMIVGAASQDRIFNAIEAKRITASVTFTTEDGSFGTRGRVTDVLDEVVASCGTGVVYACGPNPMLRAVSEACRELELPCQVAVEEHMACGVGVCWTCVLPIRTKDGGVRMKRACIDGPVFNGAKVAWDETRWAAPPEPAPGEQEPEPPAPRRPTDEELFG